MTGRDDGFTLAEMLVVLAILALAVAMVLPVSRQSLAARELTVLGGRIAAGLRQARIEAIGKNRETAVRFDLERRVASLDDSGRAVEFPKNVAINIATARGDVAGKQAAFRFFPDGTATGGHVDLGRDGQSLRIAVSWLTGAVVVEAGAP
jgi:general secretion pathway protein H